MFFLWCLDYNFLKMVVEPVDLIIVMSRYWCINLNDGDIKRSCSKADRNRSAVHWSLSHDSIHHVPMLEKSDPIFITVLFSTEINLVVSVMCRIEVVVHGVSSAKFILAEPIPLQAVS